ncbi:ORF MSV204 ALI motif gene family protein [Melanoplus sanguinipes entomopoxvirus]|uniref:ORF MSV204 ALI motif gene family protein n=1 Tax=Melanoplus sanguinipes entomopoxvirus TaxID=83191 RepID=Q9YVN8_MSEPV|nr:ORF MSV204 ALI motif gene family protein [Melanoplus sanguinipes entomopoxvirus]AAC97757.1 ORF MSV204 ALI motif gene family protein [Melanoplus sanguinipes entomopoxvirus 'O']
MEIINYNNNQIHLLYTTIGEVYYKGKDIAKILRYIDTKKVIRNNVLSTNKVNYSTLIKNVSINGQLHKTPHHTIFINTKGLKNLFDMPVKRLSNKEINDLIEFLNSHNIKKSSNSNNIIEKYNINKHNLSTSTHNTKDNILTNIIKCFKNDKYKIEYHIGEYYIDLYFPVYKIAVEYKNNNYNKNRQIEIENQLNCKFVIFDEKSNIFDIINVIHDLMMNNE